jgi:hypothetical protein
MRLGGRLVMQRDAQPIDKNEFVIHRAILGVPEGPRKQRQFDADRIVIADHAAAPRECGATSFRATGA